LDGLLYEKVNDPRLREALRNARGFCERHGWGLVRHGAALGTAIMMRDVVRTLLRGLSGTEFGDVPALSWSSLLEALGKSPQRAATSEAVAAISPQQPCPVCQYESEVEARLIASFLENLTAEGGLLAAYRESSGFCLPHFRQVLLLVDDIESYKQIVAAQQATWGRLEHQLDELVRKSDYRFSDEPLGEDGLSWLRSIAAISGERFGSRSQGNSNHKR
jgi:hypothetical protein